MPAAHARFVVLLGLLVLAGAVRHFPPPAAQYSTPDPASCFANYYWTLSNGSLTLGGDQGKAVYQALIDAASKRGVKIRIVQQEPSATFPDADSQYLAQNGLAQVRSINWTQLLHDGILHTKMFIVDQRHMYVGSANMDWTSLTQVKELGLVVKNCPAAVDDARKIFNMYFDAANLTQVPSTWPPGYDTIYNRYHPMKITLNGEPMQAFISSSPDQFCTPKRTPDVDSIITAINNAQSSVCVSVMDYLPVTLYMSPASANFYYGPIDQALRAAAFRGVKVQLLASHWNYTEPSMYQYLASLNQLNNIEVKLYTVPGIAGEVPYTRVNHAKYMVTDGVSYIGTSNWTGDYFVFTGGVGFQADSTNIRAQLQAIFDRDWSSPYATPVNNTRSG